MSPDAGLGASSPTAGLTEDRSKRLVNVEATKAAVPDRAFSGVVNGDWSAVKHITG
jgi:hypothetical protein